MTDLEFIEQFESCRFRYEEWTHEAHLRMGWYYLSHLGLRIATEKVRSGIQRLNSIIGVKGRGYHETITCFYLRVLDREVLRTNFREWADFLNKNPSLLDTSLLSQYYSDQLLNSERARTDFLLPDQKNLPSLSLSIRDLNEDDFEIIDSYWKTLGQDDLQRMYIDPSKLVFGKAFRERFISMLHTPKSESKQDSLIWEVEKKVIGMVKLKYDGEHGNPRIHLHIFDRRYQGRSLGSWFFVESCLEFMKRFQIELLHCEPATTNLYPNRLLQKLQIPLERSYHGINSPICFEQPVNSYAIHKYYLLEAKVKITNNNEV